MKILKDNICLNTEAFVLCEAFSSDAHLLYEAELLCFEGDPWSLRTFAEALENPGCKAYAICDMQMTKIVAYGVMYFCLDEADLANIAVLPFERGRGLGGLLLDEMLEISRDNGVFQIFLEVRETNEAAIGLYLSRGFEKIGNRQRYYKNPTEDAVIMVRKEQQ